MNNHAFNIRMKLSFWLIGLAIKTLPEKWQMAAAINNLMITDNIKTYKVVG